MPLLEISGRALFSAGLFALGVWIGGIGGSSERPGKTPAAVAELQTASTPPSAKRRPHRTQAGETGPAVVRPADLWVAKDAEAEVAYRKSQSRDLVDLIRRSVTRFEVMSPPNMPAEAAANAAMQYATGWVDSVMRVAPDMLDELSAEVERTACDANASPAQRVVMYRLATMYPDIATQSAFACVFEHAPPPREDLLLWSALDAFRVSGMPKTEAVLAIERSARDPRTRARLETTAETIERFKAADARGALPGAVPLHDEVAIRAEEDPSQLPPVAELGDP